MVTRLAPESVQHCKAFLDIAKDSKTLSHIVRLSIMGASPKADYQMGRWHGEVEQEIIKTGTDLFRSMAVGDSPPLSFSLF